MLLAFIQKGVYPSYDGFNINEGKIHYMSFIKYLVITISIVSLLSAQLVHAKGQGLLNLADTIKTSGSITDESFILPSDIDIFNEIISSAF